MWELQEKLEQQLQEKAGDNGGIQDTEGSTQSMIEEYEMESQMFNYEGVRKGENFGIKKYTDAIYRGDLQSGKRHGLGVMLYKKNRVYEGEWGNDLR